MSLRDLFVLYSTKNAFKLEEYADVGRVYKTLVDALANATTDGELSVNDVRYVLNAINTCSSRPIGVEVQNYKPIAALFESLSELLKKATEEDEETKED
jgi:hypothetical protein